MMCIASKFPSFIFVTVVLLLSLSCTRCSAFVPSGISSSSSRTSSSSSFELDKVFIVGSQRRPTFMASTVMESGRASFEDRMRNMVLGGGRQKKRDVVVEKKTSTAPALPSNIVICQTLGDYKRIVGGERERIVVVRFFAPWCKACKAIQPLFYRLAREFTNVLFVEVPVTESNANLHQGLGIPSLPFGHIYSPHGGLVEELKITRPHFNAFSQKLQTYVEGSCQLVNGDTQSPYDLTKPEPTISS